MPRRREHTHHTVVRKVVRTHRWQRVARDRAPTRGDDVRRPGLGRAVLDRPRRSRPLRQADGAQRADLERGLRADPRRAARDAAGDRARRRRRRRGGRFGYRFFYPPMRAGARELFWHLPLVARLRPAPAPPRSGTVAPLLGYVLAEAPAAQPRPPADRARAAAARAPRPPRGGDAVRREPGHARYTTSHNVRKLLESASCSARRCPRRSRARCSTPPSTNRSTPGWRRGRAGRRRRRRKPGARCAALLKQVVGAGGADARPRRRSDLRRHATRAFEEQLWQTIAGLAEGEFRKKENADGVPSTGQDRRPGREGRAARARAAPRSRAPRRPPARALPRAHRGARDDRPRRGGRPRLSLGDRLPFRGRGLGRNQSREAHERNIVVDDPRPRTAARR